MPGYRRRTLRCHPGLCRGAESIQHVGPCVAAGRHYGNSQLLILHARQHCALGQQQRGGPRWSHQGTPGDMWGPPLRLLEFWGFGRVPNRPNTLPPGSGCTRQTPSVYWEKKSPFLKKSKWEVLWCSIRLFNALQWLVRLLWRASVIGASRIMGFSDWCIFYDGLQWLVRLSWGWVGLVWSGVYIQKHTYTYTVFNYMSVLLFFFILVLWYNLCHVTHKFHPSQALYNHELIFCCFIIIIKYRNLNVNWRFYWYSEKSPKV